MIPKYCLYPIANSNNKINENVETIAIIAIVSAEIASRVYEYCCYSGFCSISIFYVLGEFDSLNVTALNALTGPETSGVFTHPADLHSPKNKLKEILLPATAI